MAVLSKRGGEHWHCYWHWGKTSEIAIDIGIDKGPEKELPFAIGIAIDEPPKRDIGIDIGIENSTPKNIGIGIDSQILPLLMSAYFQFHIVTRALFT